MILADFIYLTGHHWNFRDIWTWQGRRCFQVRLWHAACRWPFQGRRLCRTCWLGWLNCVAVRFKVMISSEHCYIQKAGVWSPPLLSGWQILPFFPFILNLYFLGDTLDDYGSSEWSFLGDHIFGWYYCSFSSFTYHDSNYILIMKQGLYVLKDFGIMNFFSTNSGGLIHDSCANTFAKLRHVNFLSALLAEAPSLGWHLTWFDQLTIPQLRSLWLGAIRRPARSFVHCCKCCFTWKWLLLDAFDGCQNFCNCSRKLSGISSRKTQFFSGGDPCGRFLHIAADAHAVCCKTFHEVESKTVVKL